MGRVGRWDQGKDRDHDRDDGRDQHQEGQDADYLAQFHQYYGTDGRWIGSGDLSLPPTTVVPSAFYSSDLPPAPAPGPGHPHPLYDFTPPGIDMDYIHALGLGADLGLPGLPALPPLPPGVADEIAPSSVIEDGTPRADGADGDIANRHTAALPPSPAAPPHAPAASAVPPATPPLSSTTPPHGLPAALHATWETSARAKRQRHDRDYASLSGGTSQPSQPSQPHLRGGAGSPATPLPLPQMAYAGAGGIGNGNGNGNGNGGAAWEQMAQLPRGWSGVAPGGVGPVALRQQQAQKELVMAQLADVSHPYDPAETPPNLTSILLHAQSLNGKRFRLLRDPHLQLNRLATLNLARMEITISTHLLPPMPEGALNNLFGHLDRAPHEAIPTLYERIIEQSPMLRLILGAFYVRWHYHNEYVALATNATTEEALLGRYTRDPAWSPFVQLVAGFAPVNTPEKVWESWHARYYSKLWREICQLLANKNQLDAQLCRYLRCDYAPRQGEERDEALLRMASYEVRREARAQLQREITQGRKRVRGAAPFSERAYQQREREIVLDRMYADLAQQLAVWSRVPRAVIEARLAGDSWTIRDYPRGAQDLFGMTNSLLHDMVELRHLRQWTATHGYGLPETSYDSQEGFAISAGERMALWLAEPASKFPMLKEFRTGNDRRPW